MPPSCGFPSGTLTSLTQLQQSVGAGLVPPPPLGQPPAPLPLQQLSLAQQYEQYASTIPNLLPAVPLGPAPVLPDSGNVQQAVQLQSQAHAQVHAQLQAQAQATAQLQAQLQASQLQTAQLQAQAQSHAHAQVNAQSQAQAQAQAHMFAAAQLMSMCGLGPGRPARHAGSRHARPRHAGPGHARP